MATVILVHGTYGSPEENWFPWLARNIVSEGHDVQAPEFPTPEGQSLTSWRRELARQVGESNPSWILVGHSLGALFMCDVLERSRTPILASFFVSGFASLLGNPQFDTPNGTFIRDDFDWRLIKRNAGSRYVYFGSNDPYVPRDIAEKFSEKLGVAPKIIPNGGHLNESAGFTKFEVLWGDLRKELKKQKKFRLFSR